MYRLIGTPDVGAGESSGLHFQINFHDLRQEAGSRLLEGGMPGHYVERFPDYGSLSAKSGCFNAT
jgi:hypothetical protein